MDGGAEENRTPDLSIANATLSLLSYRPKSPLQSVRANHLFDKGHRHNTYSPDDLSTVRSLQRLNQANQNF